jgi:hypothetical protein
MIMMMGNNWGGTISTDGIMWGAANNFAAMMSGCFYIHPLEGIYSYCWAS